MRFLKGTSISVFGKIYFLGETVKPQKLFTFVEQNSTLYKYKHFPFGIRITKLA